MLDVHYDSDSERLMPRNVAICLEAEVTLISCAAYVGLTKLRALLDDEGKTSTVPFNGGRPWKRIVRLRLPQREPDDADAHGSSARARVDQHRIVRP
ncbi:hypothetical protein GALL_553290 [mine drainage metagenome]|uniref:Uncharacterized protein n=1 Tax=mine drainage metagenome TaxID=410659 RepID=A0A1J5PD25_9ZZZZ